MLFSGYYIGVLNSSFNKNLILAGTKQRGYKDKSEIDLLKECCVTWGR